MSIYCVHCLREFFTCPVSRWPSSQDFLAQILDGVDWMHVNNIVHRDLKPQNILVSSDGKKLKIADLGLSRSIGSNVVLSTQVSGGSLNFSSFFAVYTEIKGQFQYSLC